MVLNRLNTSTRSSTRVPPDAESPHDAQIELVVAEVRSLLRVSPTGRSLKIVSPLSSVPVTTLSGWPLDRNQIGIRSIAPGSRMLAVQREHVAAIVEARSPLGVGVAAVDGTEIDVVGVVLDARQRVGDVEPDPFVGAPARVQIEAVELAAAGRLVLLDQAEACRPPARSGGSHPRRRPSAGPRPAPTRARWCRCGGSDDRPGC